MSEQARQIKGLRLNSRQCRSLCRWNRALRPVELSIRNLLELKPVCRKLQKADLLSNTEYLQFGFKAAFQKRVCSKPATQKHGISVNEKPPRAEPAGAFDFKCQAT